MRTNIYYGWTPDLPDRRDKVRALAAKPKLPASVDLRAKCPPVYDQGELGSCTANALAAAMQFEQARQGLPEFIPSRLFIYYNERRIEGTIHSDSGAQIRDGIKTLAKDGVPPETLWPYDFGRYQVRPGVPVYEEAKKHAAVTYARVPQTQNGIKEVLAGGLVVAFGFTVYESFESDSVAKSGILKMPGKNEQVMGGHAVLAVGYKKEGVLVRNSWGQDWGLSGHFWMPWEYITDGNLADDLWQIEAVK